MDTLKNIGYVYKNSIQKPLGKSEVEFNICDGSVLIMNKTVDKVDECYFSGDKITFTITIKNNGNKKISGLKFSDEIPDEINPLDNNEYLISSTSGIISQNNHNVLIEQIVILASQTVTITITGVV